MTEIKNSFLIVRVKRSFKSQLIKLAGGKRKLSEFVRTIIEKNLEAYSVKKGK